MDAWQLRNFLMIVECGSITQAAERLGIAQPSLSQQLLRLEDEMGVSLFKRTTRGVALTEGGRIFQEHARNILQAMQRAREEVKRLEKTPHGVVTFAMPSSTSQLLGVPLLVGCREELPDVSLKIQEAVSGTIQRWLLEDRRTDLAIVFYAENSRHLSIKWIANETLFLIGRGGEFGPVDEFGVAIEPVGVEVLNRVGLILPTMPHGIRRLIERQTERNTVELRIVIEIDALAQIRALIAAGVGHSLLPHAAVRQDLLEGKLSAARVEGVDLTRSVSLVRNPAMPITRASVEVEDMAMSLLRGMIDTGVWHTGLDGRGEPPESLREDLTAS
jgi:LysR family nitrogen assimilation transcriptional regulator